MVRLFGVTVRRRHVLQRPRSTLQQVIYHSLRLQLNKIGLFFILSFGFIFHLYKVPFYIVHRFINSSKNL